MENLMNDHAFNKDQDNKYFEQLEARLKHLDAQVSKPFSDIEYISGLIKNVNAIEGQLRRQLKELQYKAQELQLQVKASINEKNRLISILRTLKKSERK